MLCNIYLHRINREEGRGEGRRREESRREGKGRRGRVWRDRREVGGTAV